MRCNESFGTRDTNNCTRDVRVLYFAVRVLTAQLLGQRRQEQYWPDIPKLPPAFSAQRSCARARQSPNHGCSCHVSLRRRVCFALLASRSVGPVPLATCVLSSPSCGPGRSQRARGPHSQSATPVEKTAMPRFPTNEGGA